MNQGSGSGKTIKIALAAAAVIVAAAVLFLVPWYRGYMQQINFRTCMRARRKVCIDVREMKKAWGEEQAASESGEGAEELPGTEERNAALPDKDIQIEFLLQAVKNLPTDVSEPVLEAEEDGTLRFTCTGLCKAGGVTTFFLDPETGDLYGDCSLEEHLQNVNAETSYNNW